MPRKPPLLGDALSVEGHVLGRMCDSFRSRDYELGKELSSINEQYWRIEWTLSKNEKNLSYSSTVSEIYGFYFIGSNPMTPIWIKEE